MRATNRIEWAYLLLALLGIAIAGLLTSFHYSSSAAAAYCTGAGGCSSVQESPYSQLLGIPVAVLGLASYVVIAVLSALALRQWRYREWVPLSVFGLSLAGTLYSLYLTYLELFVIRATCPWCVASALVMVCLMVMSLADLLVWRRGPIEARGA